MKYALMILVCVLCFYSCIQITVSMPDSPQQPVMENESVQTPINTAQSSVTANIPADNKKNTLTSEDIIELVSKNVVMIFSEAEYQEDIARKDFVHTYLFPDRIGTPHQFWNQNMTTPIWVQGSGIVIDKRGYILTNRHVIECNYAEAAQFIYVFVLEDEMLREYMATIICRHPHDDLAVIKITPGNDSMSFYAVGDSNAVKAGNNVMAIGYPGVLKYSKGAFNRRTHPTITNGIVSALRSHDTYPYNYSMEDRQGNYQVKMIQTNSEINPGNSGGPLVNEHGDVVGIITSKVYNHEGLGFAIAINEAKELISAALARPIEGIPDGAFLSSECNGYCCNQSSIESNPTKTCIEKCNKYYANSPYQCEDRCKRNTY